MKIINYLRSLLGLHRKVYHLADDWEEYRPVHYHTPKPAPVPVVQIRKEEVIPPVNVSDYEAMKTVTSSMEALHAGSPVRPAFAYNHTPFFTQWFKFTETDEHGFKTGYVPPKAPIHVNDWRTENKIAASLILDRFPEGVVLVLDNTNASIIMSTAFKEAGSQVIRMVQLFITDNERITFMHVKRGEKTLPKSQVVEQKNFWVNEAIKLSKQYHACDSTEVKRLYAALIAKGNLVFPGGIPRIKLDSYNWKGSKWLMGDAEQSYLTEYKIRHTHREMIPAFFRYTQEQVAAYLALPFQDHGALFQYPGLSNFDKVSEEGLLFEEITYEPNKAWTNVSWQEIKIISG